MESLEFYLEQKAEAVANRVFDERKEELKNNSAARNVETDWMDEYELATYWRLLDKSDDTPNVGGIRDWSRREDNPLPFCIIGGKRRYNKQQVDRWAWEESERIRAKRRQESLRAVETNDSHKAVSKS